MSKISEHDQKEIEKYTRHLLEKFVQMVIQSRQGERCFTRSKVLPSSFDWFNLTITDKQEIVDATKNTLNQQHLEVGQPLFIEITVRTTENEKMTLEYWYLEMTNDYQLADDTDDSNPVSFCLILI